LQIERGQLYVESLRKGEIGSIVSAKAILEDERSRLIPLIGHRVRIDDDLVCGQIVEETRNCWLIQPATASRRVSPFNISEGQCGGT